MNAVKPSEHEEHEVEFVMDVVLRTLADELTNKRFGRWHYALVVCPNFDEGDAVYRVGGSLPDGSLSVLLNATGNMMRRNFPWKRRP